MEGLHLKKSESTLRARRRQRNDVSDYIQLTTLDNICNDINVTPIVLTSADVSNYIHLMALM